MNIQTAYFGETTIDPSTIITFENGIPGFEDEKQFVFFALGEESPFEIMQSTQTRDIAFVVTPPAAVVLNYSFDLDEATLQALNITSEQEVQVYAIMTLKESFLNSTVNLKAPIIINSTNRKAKQIILDSEEYMIRQPISVKGTKVE